MTETTCKIPGCDKPRKATGWCSMHYQRWKRHGDPLKSLYLQPPKKCSIDGCDSIVDARGWCSRHYQRWEHHGDPLGGGPARADMSSNLGRTCSIEGCAKSAKARGWCSMHHGRWLRNGTTDEPQPQWTKTVKPCAIDGCSAPADSRGWCDMHYQRWRNHGDPSARVALLPVPPCAVDDCGRRSAKCGVCWKHYRYFRAKFMAEQNGRCAICSVHEDDLFSKKLALDHDHATGLPRALLCHHCNWGIGHFRDNPELLRAAIAYLAETKPGQLTLFVS